MATGTLSPSPKFTGFDDNGDPLVGGKLYTYAAGTTTPLATYPGVTLTPGTENANPTILDAGGRCTLFLLPTSYKFILKNSADVTVWSQDNIGSTPTNAIDNDVPGTAGEALTATQVTYLGAGSWFKADADAASTSTLPTIAFVVADTAIAVPGTFRLSGRMTGFSGLTPGADYYVSATAGGITATAPANARYVGRADSITSLIITPNPPPASIDAQIKTICNGRLTLTTAVPVTTADVTAATTLFWTPYKGNEIALYSGSAWVAFAQTQLSIAVPATTSQMYDVFVDYNSGTPALAVTAWTNDTTRATALTTQDGVLVLTGTLGKRYVGSFRTTGVSGQTEDSYAKRYVWNYYNRVVSVLRRFETTDNWAYTTATWRQANGAAANQLDFIVGVAEDGIDAHVRSAWEQTNTSIPVSVSIGLDSTSVPSTDSLYGEQAEAGPSYKMTAVASYRSIPAAGRHVLTWLEWSFAGTGTTTWFGDTDGTISVQSGIHGTYTR